LHAQISTEFSDKWINSVIDSAHCLTKIASLSFNVQNFDITDLVLAPALQLAGLYHCVLQSQQLDQILILHFNAIEHLSKLAPDENRRAKPYLGTVDRKLAIRLLSQAWI